MHSHTVVLEHVQQRRLAGVVQSQEQDLGVLVVQACARASLGVSDRPFPPFEGSAPSRRGRAATRATKKREASDRTEVAEHVVEPVEDEHGGGLMERWAARASASGALDGGVEGFSPPRK